MPQEPLIGKPWTRTNSKALLFNSLKTINRALRKRCMSSCHEQLKKKTSQHYMRTNRRLTYVNTADIFKLTVVLCISVSTNLLFSLMRYLLSNRVNLGYSTQLFVSPSHFSLDNFVMLTDSLTRLWITGSSCGKDWQRDGNRECVCVFGGVVL